MTRQKGKGKSRSRSRFPAGMTSQKDNSNSNCNSNSYFACDVNETPGLFVIARLILALIQWIGGVLFESFGYATMF
jgi:hypothetical protein